LRALLVLALVGAAVASCKINDQCLECETGDGGHGGSDAPGSDGSAGDGSNCTPTAETCNGKDDDCDGVIDNDPTDVNQPCSNSMGECATATTQCLPTVAGDLTTDRLVCVDPGNNMIVPRPEVCDNVDNNCNGMVDEGDPGGGAKCGGYMFTGTCVAGISHCVTGSVQCVGGTGPQPEVCDGLDNDCDNVIDEDLTNLGTCGAPEPGCASPPCGLCKLGTLSCVGATQVCMGATNPVPEKCNTFDDDCDGKIDEDFDTKTDPQNCGSCGNVCGAGLTDAGNAQWGCAEDPVTHVGKCKITSCNAGYHDNNNDPSDGCEFGPCFTSGAEVCDGLDNDCDGMIDETPAIGTAPGICQTQGECAGTIATCPCANTPDALGCTNFDGWTCNYPSTVSTDMSGNIIPETACDGLDNDCNGWIDDNQSPMRHADGTTLTPVACNDGTVNVGICESFGTYECPQPPLPNTGPAVCNYTTVGQTAQPESCNNLDDDCDGKVDEDVPAGTITGRDWIDIGGGHEMMKYEASRPDSDGTTSGAVSTTACHQINLKAGTAGASESSTTATFTTVAAHGFTVGQVVTIAGVGVTGYNGTWQIVSTTATTFTVTLTKTGLANSGGGSASQNCVATCSKLHAEPWTNVTYLQALSACQSIGATLCTESAWHRACSTVAPTTYPLSVGTATAVFIEAEDYSAISYATDSGGTTRSWVEDETPGFSGISDLQAVPDTGASLSSGNSTLQAPRLDYLIDFTNATAASYFVWVRMFSGNSNANRVYLGLNAAVPPQAPTVAVQTASNGTWQWVTAVNGMGNPVAFGVPGSGNRYLSIFMARDGVKVDAIYISTSNTTPTPTLKGPGGEWAYASSPSSYARDTCNGADYNTDLSQPDAPLPTGSLANCYANDETFTGSSADEAFDMSGNVKEWGLAHQPGENPIRGGASDDTGPGTSCPLDFTLGDNTFFFPDVGFRCCK
jgi:hypothetical protein